MSDMGVIGVLGALFISGTFVTFYCTAKINERSHEILGGVISGVPVSLRYRRWLLWMTWMPQWAAIVAVSVIYASIFLTMASVAASEEIRGVAYLCAGAAGFSALFFLVFGVPHIHLCVSTLRDAEPPRQTSQTTS